MTLYFKKYATVLYFIVYLFIVFVFSFVLKSCSDSSSIDSDPTLVLKWNKSYPNDSISNAVIGLQWTFSYIGAILPVNEPGIQFNDSLIRINIETLGFPKHTYNKLLSIHDAIKKSEEYAVRRTIDLGRYVSLLIGSSKHYYSLTDTPKSLDDLMHQYTLKSDSGYINNSGVSLKHRVIKYSAQDEFNQLFISTEIDSVNHEIFEYETLELMANGQVRFGIYDTEGLLKDYADPMHSEGGKPAKCMWCHESGIQPLFNDQVDQAGYLPFLSFYDTLNSYKNKHEALQILLIDGVDYSKEQQHAFTELLYISFMEPSIARLSHEWGMPEEEIKPLLKGLSPHLYEEYPFLGELYYRADVNRFSPFKGIEVSSFVREYSVKEVNYIR